MIRTRRWDLTAGQVLTMDIRRSEGPITWSVVTDNAATVTAEITLDPEPVAADWLPIDSLTLWPRRTSTIRPDKTTVDVLTVPVAKIRFSAVGGTAKVRISYRESIAATVT